MRRLAKTAATILLTCSGFSFALIATVCAQESVSSPSNTAPNTQHDAPDDLVSQIISAAEKDGVRVIVIDGTAQKDNSKAPKSTSDWVPSAADYENLTMTMTPSTGSSLMKAQTEVLKFREILKAKFAELPGSLETTHNELKRKSPTGDLNPYIRALYWSVLLLAFGAWLEHQVYVKHIVARWLKPDLMSNPVGYLEKLPLLMKRAVLKIIGVIISMVIAFSIGALLFNETPPESIQFTIATLYLGYAACRLVAITWRLILVPYLCQYRIPHFSNQNALKLYHWLLIVSLINIVLIMIGIWVGELGGKSHLHAVMASIFGACVALLNIMMVIINRKPLSRAIRNGKKLDLAVHCRRLLCFFMD